MADQHGTDLLYLPIGGRLGSELDSTVGRENIGTG